MPPCGRIDEADFPDFQQSEDAEDDQLGLEYMQRPQYVHVTDAIQLDLGPFSRFSWAASWLLPAACCIQKGEVWETMKKKWKDAVNEHWKDAFEDALTSHLLFHYENNLERAYSGLPSFSPENLALQLCSNADILCKTWSRCQERLQGGSQFDASKVVLQAAEGSGLSPELANAMKSHVSAASSVDLASCLAGANLAVCVVGTAGTWYGLWCIHHNLISFREGTVLMHQDVMQQLDNILAELQSLPQKITSHLKIMKVQENMEGLKAIAKVIADNFHLLPSLENATSRERIIAESESHIRDAKAASNLVVNDLEGLLQLLCKMSESSLENSYDSYCTFAPPLAGRE